MMKHQNKSRRLAALSTTAALIAGATGLLAAPVIAVEFTKSTTESSEDPVSLKLAPKEGAQTVLDTSVSREIEGGDLEVFMNGGAVPKQFLPELSFQMTTVTKVNVSDTAMAPKDDGLGPWSLRTVEEASSSFQMEMSNSGETTEFESEASCDLTGEPMVVGRDSDGDTVAEWAQEDSKLDPELLAGVRPGLQLEGLLPGDPVETGGRWEADAAALGDVLLLDSSLPWTWSGPGADAAPEGGDTVLSGRLELTATEIREEGGETLVTVELTGELVEVLTRATDLAQVPVADGTATEVSTTTYALEGEFVWNATSGTLASMALKGEGSGEQRIDKDAGQEGGEYYSTTQHTATLAVSVN